MYSDALEDRRLVRHVRQLAQVVAAEEPGVDRRQERRVARGRYLGEVLQQRDVLRTAAELEVADDGAIGLAARGVVLVLVHVLVEPALRHLGSILEVLEQLPAC